MKLIAELCQNHNGNEDILFKMVDAAAEAGATHIKIQHIYSKNLTYRPEFENGLNINGEIKSIKRPWINEYERLKKIELTEKTCSKFVEYVKSIKLTPMTTCFARGDIKEIEDQGFEEVKVASYDCASFQLIKELAEKFEHIYVSTGATFDDEIEYANTILKESAKKYTLLHCVTQYPTPLSSMNLLRLEYLKGLCENVGFSDHSLVSRDGVVAAKAAIYMGAEAVERHFTTLGADESKDGPVSINGNELKSISDFTKLNKENQLRELQNKYPNWRILIGTKVRRLSPEELLNRAYYRGRFATRRYKDSQDANEMIFNWEAIPV